MSTNDKSTHALLQISGFRCLNPCDHPTQSSGTTVDLFLTNYDGHLPEPFVGVPGALARSDHSFLHLRVPVTLHCRYSIGIGRVWWASCDEWAASLSTIDTSLSQLAAVASRVSLNTSLLDMAANRKARKYRRKLVDAFVWLREAWYCITGHLSGAVRSSKVNASQCKTASGSAQSTAEQQDSEWKRARKSLNRYLELRQNDRSAADRLLSTWFKPPESLVLQLIDTSTLQTLHGPECIPQVKQDLIARATSTAAAFPVQAAATQEYVSSIRNSSALRHPDTGIQLDCLTTNYTCEELDGIIRNLDSGSRCLRL